MIGAGDGSVELPAGEHGDAAGADGGLDDFFVASDALAGESRMNSAEQLVADRSFSEREEQRFVQWIGRTLRGGIEAADGVYLVAEEFDADGALGLGRVNIEDAAAKGVLAGHFDHVGTRIADGVEMRQ